MHTVKLTETLMSDPSGQSANLVNSATPIISAHTPSGLLCPFAATAMRNDWSHQLTMWSEEAVFSV